MVFGVERNNVGCTRIGLISREWLRGNSYKFNYTYHRCVFDMIPIQSTQPTTPHRHPIPIISHNTTIASLIMHSSRGVSPQSSALLVKPFVNIDVRQRNSHSARPLLLSQIGSGGWLASLSTPHKLTNKLAECRTGNVIKWSPPTFDLLLCINIINCLNQELIMRLALTWTMALHDDDASVRCH